MRSKVWLGSRLASRLRLESDTWSYSLDPKPARFVKFSLVTSLFFLAQILMPGDFAILVEYGEGAEKVMELRQELGLDKPIHMRYLILVGKYTERRSGEIIFYHAGLPVPGQQDDPLTG